MCEVFQMQLTK